MFLVNSRLSFVIATTSGLKSKSYHPTMAPLLPKLRGYFAEFLNEGYLEHLSILYLPTCVGFSTRTKLLTRGFSWQHRINYFTAIGSASRLRLNVSRIFLTDTLLACTQNNQTALTYLSASPHCSNIIWLYRNINLLSIAYAFRPQLRPRLTLGGLPFPRKP